MADFRSLNILAINWQDIKNPFGGGAEVHFHEIFRRVAASGHHVTLLCCAFQGAKTEEMVDGIKIIRRGSRNFFNYCVPAEYKKLRKNRQFDIVIDDINKIPFYTPLYVKEPVLAILHHFFSKSIYLETSFIPASYVYLSEKLVPRIYHKVPFAVVSESTRQELIREGVRSPIELVPNAVDPALYDYLPQLRSETPLIGYLGRVKKYKSIDHILRAMPDVLSAIPETRLLIIGDGDYRKNLEEIAFSLGIRDKVRFTGHVPQEEKVKLLNTLWLAVNPSPKEGWGLTVIEANACGVPVIAADSPGLRDSVVHEETGQLYPYGNIQQLANQIIKLLNTQENISKFSKNSLNWVNNFSWNESATKIIDIIKAAIGHKSRRDL
ncbi:glycosyltransferase family 4 protein [candidate division KSB1 bacterium]|nr:glycosyltransferase family 4 protein [candidate division KSB1 bacterium]